MQHLLMEDIEEAKSRILSHVGDYIFSEEEVRKKLGYKHKRKIPIFQKACNELMEEGKLRRIYDEEYREYRISKPPMQLEKPIECPSFQAKLGCVEEEWCTIYFFTISGKDLADMVQIRRAIKIEGKPIEWFQRRKIDDFIRMIRDRLDEDPAPLIADTVMVAIHRPEKVKWHPSEWSDDFGTLEITYSPCYATQERPFILIDGQQRLRAIKVSKKDITIPLIAIKERDKNVWVKQFVIANTKKPVPKPLLRELHTIISAAELPSSMRWTKVISEIVDRLDTESDSPFNNLIRSPVRREVDRVVTHTHIYESIERCLNGNYYTKIAMKKKSDKSDQKLFLEYCLTGDIIDKDHVTKVIRACWAAVREVFPDAWGKSPTKSKLMHGAGIRAMFELLAYIVDSNELAYSSEKDLQDHVHKELKKIKDKCYWTEDDWEKYKQGIGEEIKRLNEHINELKKREMPKEMIEDLEKAAKARERELEFVIWKHAQVVPAHIKWLGEELIKTYESTLVS